jgi:hypothetical protein
MCSQCDQSSAKIARQLWVAAAKAEQAVTLVLCEVPEGWTAAVTGERLAP